MLGKFEDAYLNVSGSVLLHTPMTEQGYQGFEQANQPSISDIDARNLLNFCVVGENVQSPKDARFNLLQRRRAYRDRVLRRIARPYSYRRREALSRPSATLQDHDI
jgi:hypothetical protein